MNKVLLILPWFGQLPIYWDKFLYSCGQNKTFNFLILTDCEVNNTFENILVKHLSWTEFKNLVQDKFEFKISLESPYKICDYKPAYGDIFSEYIKNFDFWGHIDCDLIFGDLSILHDLLNEVDRFGMWGHLCIYRNDPEVNSWYKNLKSKNVPSYKEIYSQPQNYSFDEFGGMNILLEENNKRTNYVRLFDDIVFYSNNLFSRRKFLQYQPNHKTLQFFEYKNSKLFRYIYIYINGLWQVDESIYCHLQKRRMDVKTDETSSFYIVPNSFLPHDIPIEQIKKSLISKSGLDYPYYKMMIKHFFSSTFKSIRSRNIL